MGDAPESVDDLDDGRDDVHETLLPSITLSIMGRGDSSSPGLFFPGDLGLAAPVSAITAPPLSDATGERVRGARVGDVIGGRYVVEAQLGRGGMGRVLRARHQALGKAFALKLIKTPIAMDPRIREMFYREARLASACSHDNICSMVDFGEDPAFGLFMVMELLDGQTMHSKLRQGGRLAPKVACDVLWQVCEALRYIHGRAIIHSDIKSENIFLVKSPAQRRVIKLLDFGLSRPDRASSMGQVDGTPEYLAPERISGGPATVASDLYALGVLMFELLTGKLPFTGTLDEVFELQLHGTIPTPSSVVDEALDTRADEIVARATAKNPLDRHADVAGFMYELRTLMNMLGMETQRRRGGNTDATRERHAADHRTKAAFEVFSSAPIPMAACDITGKVRIANTAFLEFLGCAGDVAGIELRDSGMLEVYPGLMRDLAAATARRTTVKRVIYLSGGGGATVEVAVLITPAAASAEVTAGELHLALHPLRAV
jgi:tRNA A-37 threonylcarbamoyl transferase component Bud32/PAS domain-containing protein